MREAIKRMIDRGFSAEQGQVLTLTIILLALGTLMIIPLLDYMSAGVKTTSQVYEKKTDELAAADAGITDAEWQITYDNITTFTNPVAYSPYDYNTSWTYSLPEQVNAKDTSVTINNVWIPKNINKPDKTLAETIIKTGKLMVTGSVSGASTYQIKITYFKEGTDAPLEVQTIGVWLPPGFSYVDGSSNLESDPSAPYYPSSVSVDPWDSGQAVIWTFESGTLFAGSQGTFPIPPFPGIDITELPMTAIINFGYISQKGGAPNPVSWITTEGVNDIPFSWEAENRFYHISSVAGGTQIDSYTAKSELRQMQSAIAGDYYATGNSNLSSVGSSKNRTKWNDPSSAEVTTANIPPDANVAAAYLYWTGWKNDNSITAVSPLNPDKCNDFTNWTAGSGWDYTSSAGRFTGHNYGIGADLTLKNSLNLSAYSSGLATLTWDQSTNGSLTADDGLDFAFSTDGGSNWSGNIIAFRGPSTPPGSFSYNIPPQYLISGNFKVRFSLVGFGNSGRYCYLDNIKISGMTPDPSVIFRIDNRIWSRAGLPGCQ